MRICFFTFGVTVTVILIPWMYPFHQSWSCCGNSYLPWFEAQIHPRRPNLCKGNHFVSIDLTFNQAIKVKHTLKNIHIFLNNKSWLGILYTTFTATSTFRKSRFCFYNNLFQQKNKNPCLSWYIEVGKSRINFAMPFLPLLRSWRMRFRFCSNTCTEPRTTAAWMSDWMLRQWCLKEIMEMHSFGECPIGASHSSKRSTLSLTFAWLSI